MPFLRCFYVFEISCFADWVADRNLPANSQPGDVVNGIPLGARYVFGIDSMDAVLNEYNEPVFCVKFDENGAPYIQFARQARGEGEATLEVFATTDITDWSHAVPVEVDLGDGRYIPDVDPIPPAMFFRWRMRIAGY